MRLAGWCLVLVMAAGVGWAQGPFRFRDVNPDSIELSEGGRPVYVYNHGMLLANGAPESKRRSGYLHPVYAPDGTMVTDDFPRDHFHHRGIFWAWPIVRVGGAKYDQWLVTGANRRTLAAPKLEVRGGVARLIAENGWFAGEKRIVRERVEIGAQAANGARRTLDFTLTLEAVDAPVEIEGEPTQNKGYGGFSVRFARRDRTVVTTDAGVEARDTDMVPHPWAQLEGIFGGRRAGLRIDVDPGNPGAPNGWCLRNYGFLGVNFPGRKVFVLEKGKPLVMKYRVTVYSGEGR